MHLRPITAASMQGRNIAGSASNVLDFSARVENTSLAIYSQA